MTASFWVPTMIYALLDHPRTRQSDLSSLRTIIYGASPSVRVGFRRRSICSARSSSGVRPERQAPTPPLSFAVNNTTRSISSQLESCLLALMSQILDKDDREDPAARPKAPAFAARSSWTGTGSAWRQTAARTLRGELASYRRCCYTGTRTTSSTSVDRTKEMIVKRRASMCFRGKSKINVSATRKSRRSRDRRARWKWGEAVKAIVVRA